MSDEKNKTGKRREMPRAQINRLWIVYFYNFCVALIQNQMQKHTYSNNANVKRENNTGKA